MIFLSRKNNLIIVRVMLIAGCFAVLIAFDYEALANVMQKMVPEKKKNSGNLLTLHGKTF